LVWRAGSWVDFLIVLDKLWELASIRLVSKELRFLDGVDITCAGIISLRGTTAIG
jgi:hypothetical protein